MADHDDDFIVRGSDPIFEPGPGGLGYEFFQSFTRSKGKLAQIFIDNDGYDTYDDLLQRCVKTAIFLRKRNLKEDDVVCKCMPNNLNCMVPFIAAKFVGVNYATLEPTMSEEDFIKSLQYLQPKILFVSEDAVEMIEKYFVKASYKCELVVMYNHDRKNPNPYKFFNTLKEEKNFQPIFIEDLKKTALIVLSSGTTGAPKGVCCNHYGILSQIFITASNIHRKGTIEFSNFSHKFDDKEESKFLLYSPIYWVTGLFFTMIPFFSGGVRVIGTQFEVKETWKTLLKYEPDTAFIHQLQANDLCLYASNKKPNTSLNVLVMAGRLVSKRTISGLEKCFPNSKITQTFGQTEQSGGVTAFNIDDPEEMELQRSNPESCGKIMPGIQMRIVDIDTEKTCEFNKPGELRLKNKFLMNGYYKMDASADFDSDGWFKTGDYAYIDENGCLFILDRIKYLLHYRSHRIRARVIEELFLQHPAVQEVIVIGLPHETDTEHPMGVAVLRPEYIGKISEEELECFVNERVPSDEYKIRGGVKFVKEVLKTLNGKDKKCVMKRLILEGKI